MSWLRRITGRMVTKVFLAIGLVVGFALIVKAYLDAARLADAMKRQTRSSGENLAKTIVASIEHSMLAGEGIAVRSLVTELGERLDSAEIHVYDPRGIEVFAPAAPPPARSDLPRAIAATLDGAGRQVGDDGEIVRPIEHEPRCERCHPASTGPRGVLVLDIDDTACRDRRDDAVASIIEAGFTHVMTARNAEQLDEYFAELVAAAPRVRGVAVLDAAGDPAYASGEDVAIEPAAVAAALAPGAGRVVSASGGELLATVPLMMDERCVQCHDEPIGTTRGVLAVTLTAAPPACHPDELEALADTSVRYVMLSALGRRIADLLDAIAATGAVRRLDLYDPDGRRYWTTRHPAPPPEIATLLAGGGEISRTHGGGTGERIEVIAPLDNRPACRRCHGAATPTRGAVSVSLSTGDAALARDERIAESGRFTAYTLGGILLILGAVLQYLVVRPVNRIGDVADEVGRGNLDVTVARADPDGDEVARLAARVNEMVIGLRTKLALEKFVSRGASAAAHGAAAGLGHPEGERRRMVVLFTDIRGFTAFSEERDPEAVVAMLNQLLGVQAAIVQRAGGDIDKFVGDELMALFSGDDAERRAVTCAVEMVAAVDQLGRQLTIGVGVHVGEVVYGAIGHQDRLDFTVIGDVVNTGARLCSAAAGGEVLISREVHAAAESFPGLVCEEREPLALKGKKSPFAVLRVRAA
jgi:class 3 adenylate cyclase